MNIDRSLFSQSPVGDLPALKVENNYASALISLYGGQVLSFRPKGEEDVLWLSADALFEEGSAIRGGVPICWPWFGKRAVGGANHGYARLSQWYLVSAIALAGGETRMTLALEKETLKSAIGWVDADLTLEVTVGKSLTIKLVTTNNGQEPINLSQALHSYFNVSDVEQIHITGLEETGYQDSADNNRDHIQDDVITIKGEVDRAYLNTFSTCVIHDQGLSRRIVIDKSGSNSTVVWNPGAELAAKNGRRANQ